jgi:hypothetical protein
MRNPLHARVPRNAKTEEKKRDFGAKIHADTFAVPDGNQADAARELAALSRSLDEVISLLRWMGTGEFSPRRLRTRGSCSSSSSSISISSVLRRLSPEPESSPSRMGLKSGHSSRAIFGDSLCGRMFGLQTTALFNLPFSRFVFPVHPFYILSLSPTLRLLFFFVVVVVAFLHPARSRKSTSCAIQL